MTRTPRQKFEQQELSVLCRQAAASSRSEGRAREEQPPATRTIYQEDCQRIVQCKAFRRLRGKTQVFLWPKGDHYRTRLTHCLEVSQIARTISRALDLNEDLTEAIALGHDLGHTPFGHAGEEALERLVPGGFRHEVQSLRVVERLENEGEGLNLSAEVRDGILRHSKGRAPLCSASADALPRTLEGQVVRWADVIAYVNHDLDDALRARVIGGADLPQGVEQALGKTLSARIDSLIQDLIESTDFNADCAVRLSEGTAASLEALRSFLFENVYFNDTVHGEFAKASSLLERLWSYLLQNHDRFYKDIWPTALRDGSPEDDVRDFLAGMTDAYAVDLHNQLFTPRRWYVL